MQHRFEEVFFHLLKQLASARSLEDLAMAGGCALNSVANGKLFYQTPFRRTWIQPAAGDEGLAIGAALHTYHSVLKQPRRYQMKNSYLGPEFSDSRIEVGSEESQPKYRKLEREPLLEAVAEQIAAAMSWAGFKGGWSGDRGRWAIAPSWPILACPT